MSLFSYNDAYIKYTHIYVYYKNSEQSMLEPALAKRVEGGC